MAAVSGPPLHLHAVSWWFNRGVKVLDDVDLEVGRGACVVVRGGNGSGKTTLARLAAGALVAKRGRAERAEPVAYVPQASDNPPVRMRARRWLDALARMRRAGPVDDAIEALGIRGVVHRPMTDLSTGTIVKVLIAGAVSGTPALLVCDEPFADLDADGRLAVQTLLTDLRAGGCAILLTDHTQTSHAFADRVLELKDGELV
jgi:ABC-type Mn2+/Zn2+ transport system ATPase subunit